MKALVKAKAPTVIQVGANLGEEIRAFRNLWGPTSIYCFEPRPDAFEVLRQEWDSYSHVHLVNKAVSKTRGSMTLHVNHLAGTSSLLEINAESEYYRPEFAERAAITVHTVTLDDFCEAEKIRTIDLLMIDVQGGELDVLEGAVNLLSRRAIDVIYIEVFFVDLYKDCPQFDDVANYLNGHGFVFHSFHNPGRVPPTPAPWSDALFVRGG